ncbi:MAG: hypothetical protein HY200_04125 [Nitrospirae bacterium]|nr:hypothetical protein [Nitrospirota bacterium]MBI3594121.1 hypothetical protein [Nitrospirota bacterium]
MNRKKMEYSGISIFYFIVMMVFFIVSPNAKGEDYPENSKEQFGKGLLFGVPDINVEWHGFISVEYFDNQADAENPIPSFDSHNFYLSARAEIGTELVLFGEVEHEHGATVKIDRAFMDWQIEPYLTFRIGRFYVPFSYERVNYWAPARPMASRPFLVDIPFHEWSDSGIEILGRTGMIGYDFSIVNGPTALTENGIAITDDRDNNRNKAVVGRLNFFPLPLLQAGVAYAQGIYNIAGDKAYQLYEVDARWRPGKFDIWFEYDKRTGDDEGCSANSPPCDPAFTGDVANKEGYYVLASYNLIEDRKRIHYLKPILRFDTIKSSDAGSGYRRETVGLNWSPFAHFLLRSEYGYTQEIDQPNLANDGYMLSAVIDF